MEKSAGFHVPIIPNYILDKAMPKKAPENRQAGDSPNLSPQGLSDFEDLFLAWLPRNREELEAGGAGDLEDLAIKSFHWATMLKPIVPSQ